MAIGGKGGSGRPCYPACGSSTRPATGCFQLMFEQLKTEAATAGGPQSRIGVMVGALLVLGAVIFGVATFSGKKGPERLPGAQDPREVEAVVEAAIDTSRLPAEDDASVHGQYQADGVAYLREVVDQDLSRLALRMSPEAIEAIPFAEARGEVFEVQGGIEALVQEAWGPNGQGAPLVGAHRGRRRRARDRAPSLARLRPRGWTSRRRLSGRDRLPRGRRSGAGARGLPAAPDGHLRDGDRSGAGSRADGHAACHGVPEAPSPRRGGRPSPGGGLGRHQGPLHRGDPALAGAGALPGHPMGPGLRARPDRRGHPLREAKVEYWGKDVFDQWGEEVENEDSSAPRPFTESLRGRVFKTTGLIGSFQKESWATMPRISAAWDIDTLYLLDVVSDHWGNRAIRCWSAFPLETYGQVKGDKWEHVAVYGFFLKNHTYKTRQLRDGTSADHTMPMFIVIHIEPLPIETPPYGTLMWFIGGTLVLLAVVFYFVLGHGAKKEEERLHAQRIARRRARTGGMPLNPKGGEGGEPGGDSDGDSDGESGAGPGGASESSEGA